MSVCGENTFRYDQQAHVRSISSWIEKIELSNHIQIIKQTDKISLPETNSNYFSQYLIRFKKLTIETGHYESPLSMDVLVNNEKYPSTSNQADDRYNGGFFLEFSNCEFVASQADKNCYCQFHLGAHAYLKIENSRFRKVDVYVVVGGTASAVIELRGNTFPNRHVSIGGGGGMNFKTGEGWTLRPELASRVLGAKPLERFINKEARKTWEALEKQAQDNPAAIEISDLLKAYIADKRSVKVQPEHLASPDSEVIARIKDNTFTTLRFGGLLNYFFLGQNKIDRLEIGMIPPFVSWGQYQIVDAKKQYGHHHKSLFVLLKQKSEAENDISQSLILQREITRCERAVISHEPLRVSWQDRFIYCFSNTLSSYGTSWARPFVILILLNVVIGALAFWIVQTGCDVSSSRLEAFFRRLISWGLVESHPTSCDMPPQWPYVFAELFNPVSSLSSITGSKSGAISALNLIQKAFFAAIIYDMVKTFRRFGRPR